MSQFYLQSDSSGPVPPDIPTSFVTDSGTVIPSFNVVNVNGGPGIEVIANPNGSNNMEIIATEVAPNYVNVDSSMSPYTVTATDYYISVDASGGAVIINLPDAPTADRQFIIKDRLGVSQTNNITIQSITGASTIDQQSNYTFIDNFESLECLWHGGNYEIF